METNGYSSNVELRLFVGGESIDVAQTGRDSVILREPRELAAGPAELIITIDGRTDRLPIVLRPTGTGPTRLVSYW
jgi:hypothetical protein